MALEPIPCIHCGSSSTTLDPEDRFLRCECAALTVYKYAQHIHLARMAAGSEVPGYCRVCSLASGALVPNDQCSSLTHVMPVGAPPVLRSPIWLKHYFFEVFQLRSAALSTFEQDLRAFSDLRAWPGLPARNMEEAVALIRAEDSKAEGRRA